MRTSTFDSVRGCVCRLAWPLHRAPPSLARPMESSGHPPSILQQQEHITVVNLPNSHGVCCAGLRWSCDLRKRHAAEEGPCSFGDDPSKTLTPAESGWGTSWGLTWASELLSIPAGSTIGESGDPPFGAVCWL